MPTVSIIITTRNRKNFSEQILAKIFEQSYKDFEVVIVDLGSTDGSHDIYQRYPVKVVDFNLKKLNYARAFNLGARSSSGKYLVRLAGDAVPADDHWLENLIDHLEKNENIAGVYSRWLVARENNNLADIIFAKVCFGSERLDFKHLPNWFGTAGSLRRELWEKYPFDEKINFCEDTDWAVWAQHHGHKLIYEPASRVYHHHQDSLLKFLNRSINITYNLFKIMLRKVSGHYND